ncbi:MAG: hypothetical protein JRE28_12855 [Deltaproteobacteria bacterium]|nr:hypothetical protein [Deltaproteobacteria bacterium]
MVKGIDQFRAHFGGFNDRYVLIGGAACYLAMEEAGLDFRVTKDLDIVLCVEALDAEFVSVFWNFIKKAGYHNRQKSTGKKLFYRFYEPEDATFPWMLELFSRIPDALNLHDDAHLTPIPVDEKASSLSAILLDNAYYSFIHESKMESDGLTVVPPENLVPLKAKAWLDLNKRRDEGENVDEKDIKKHKNDVFRLFQVIAPNTRIVIPSTIKDDLKGFLQAVQADPPKSLKPFGLGATKADEVIKTLREIYELST